MITSVIWVNVFFVPAIALWCHYKRNELKIEPSIKMLIKYAILSVLNIPLTKVGIFLAKTLLHREISIDSGYYTLMAVTAAMVLPFFIDLAKNVCENRAALFQKIKLTLKKRSMKYKEKWIAALLLTLLIVVTYGIRGPIEIYAGNAGEFLFALEDFIFPMLIVQAVVLIATSFLLALLSDVPFRFMSMILMWIGISSWIQDVFLNTKLIEVNGGPMDWESLSLYSKTNLLVWIGLFVGVLIICIRTKKSWFSVSNLVAGALCAVQLTAVVSLLFTMPGHQAVEIEKQLSGERQMELASDENVIVFIMDTVGVNAIKKMMDEYPENKEIVKDFVFYDNACSDYEPTFPSLTHLLTGQELEFGGNASDWLQNAWGSEQSNYFFQQLKDAGYTCHLYSSVGEIKYIFGGAENLMNKFDNVQEVEMQIDMVDLLQKLLKLSAYRCVPYMCKPFFEVLTLDFNDVVSMVNVAAPSFTNQDFYQRLTSDRLSANLEIDKLFYVNHILGAHPPWQTSANVSFIEETTELNTVRGLFVMLQEYLDQMKALGIYDSANIIVMSDHGAWGWDDIAPMFFLKRSGETHSSMCINSSPVSYQDFQATILELIGKHDGSLGTSIFDWKPGQERRRVLYRTNANNNVPSIPGSAWNEYWGFIYYKNIEELYTRLREHGIKPDYIETALSR